MKIVISKKMIASFFINIVIVIIGIIAGYLIKCALL